MLLLLKIHLVLFALAILSSGMAATTNIASRDETAEVESRDVMKSTLPGTGPGPEVKDCALHYWTNKVSYGQKVYFDQIIGGTRVSKNGAIRFYPVSVEPKKALVYLRNDSTKYDYEFTYIFMPNGLGGWQSLTLYIYKGSLCILSQTDYNTLKVDLKNTFTRTIGGR